MWPSVWLFLINMVTMWGCLCLSLCFFHVCVTFKDCGTKLAQIHSFVFMLTRTHFGPGLDIGNTEFQTEWTLMWQVRRRSWTHLCNLDTPVQEPLSSDLISVETDIIKEATKGHQWGNQLDRWCQTDSQQTTHMRMINAGHDIRFLHTHTHISVLQQMCTGHIQKRHFRMKIKLNNQIMGNDRKLRENQRCKCPTAALVHLLCTLRSWWSYENNERAD